jgi:hypothetical protein
VAPAIAVVVAGTWRARAAWPPAAAPALSLLAMFAAAWHLTVVAPAVSPAVTRFWAARYVALSAADADAGGAQSLGLGLYRLVAGAVGGGTVHVAGAVLLAGAALVRRPAVALALLLPVGGAVAAAAAGRAPIGGRPDAYLVPLIALAMAAGLDALLRPEPPPAPAPLRRPVAAAALALAAAVLLADVPARAVPAPYPRQDVRSLAGIWAARRAPGDHLLVQAGGGPAFALYSDARLVTRRGTRKLAHATVDDPAVSVLPWRLRRAPDASAEAVRAAVDHRAARVWVLMANGRREDAPGLREAVGGLGFELEARWTTDGAAELSLYRRR